MKVITSFLSYDMTVTTALVALVTTGIANNQQSESSDKTSVVGDK